MTLALPTVLLLQSAQDDRTMYAEYLRTTGFRPLEVADTADACNWPRTPTSSSPAFECPARLTVSNSFVVSAI